MTHRYQLLLNAAVLALTPALAAPVLGAPVLGAPVLGAGAPQRALRTSQAMAFNPPQGPLVLSRELRKGFGTRHEFVSRRRYEIRFVPDGAGWRVDGRLIASEVETPPGMAPQLAELERGRSDAGLFPMHLDGAGRIIAQPGGGDPAGDAQTLATARQVLANAGLPPAESAAALQLAAQLQSQARAAGNNWPADLFHPEQGQRSEERALSLGSAGEGKVTIAIDAQGDDRGILARLQRRIVTEAAGNKRLSIETWSLDQPG